MPGSHAMSDLRELAENLADELGQGFHLRLSYPFAFPQNGGVGTRILPAAIFASATPSFNSALVGFAAPDAPFDELGYLGAPIVIRQTNGNFEALQFTAPLVAESLGESPVGSASSWLRADVLPRINDRRQMKLQLGGSDLLLNETTDSLRSVVAQLMTELRESAGFDARTAFDTALDIVRSIALQKPPHTDLDHYLMERFQNRIAFHNIPLEAIGALYESLATTIQYRRDRGLFYTPDWLASRLIGRLDRKTVLSGGAVDPAVGSGTFLLCFLERYVQERTRSEPDYTPSITDLVNTVAGVDNDPVAIATTRLTLDLFADRLNLPSGDWHLHEFDSTEKSIAARSLVGNLPFGYRSHRNGGDLAAAILEKWLEHNDDLQALALILPYSFTYDRTSRTARQKLLEKLRIDELVMLPEEAFRGSSVLTMGVIATQGRQADAVLVRRVDRNTLPEFRRSGATRTHSAVIPDHPGDPWVLTPLYPEFASAVARRASTLKHHVVAHVGLQAYGVPDKPIAERVAKTWDAPAILDDARRFLRWRTAQLQELPRLNVHPSELRRTGPADKYAEPKLIVRRVTNPKQRGRLATIYDTDGLWFTDRFVGVWLRSGSPIPLPALAAYFQTSFVEAWFTSHNPSRTLRIASLYELPIPKLPHSWWERASNLSPPGVPIMSPRWKQQSPQGELFAQTDDMDSDWQWFEAVVLNAFGVEASSRRLESFLVDYLTVGGVTE